MPLIRVRSLPLNQWVDIQNNMTAISLELSKELEMDLQHISITWDFMQPNAYMVGGNLSDSPLQPEDSHPILVELVVPDFHSQSAIETMLKSLARSIAHYTETTESNVFINTRLVASGHVWDNGEIVRW